ncbi:MAG: ankyrin repeat domain-containing protein [Syntrophales bacterium]
MKARLILFLLALTVGCAGPLVTAAGRGDVNSVKAIVEDKTHPIELKEKNRALCQASYEGHIKVVELLIDKGADLNAKCSIIGNGGTSLIDSVWKGHSAVSKFLIDKGADINAKDAFGRTALFFALIRRNIEIAKILMDKGADIDSEVAFFEGKAAEKPKDADYVFGLNYLKNYAKKTEISAKSASVKPTEISSSSPLIRSDIDELPSMKTKPNRNAYAIVIGIENYRQKLPRADFAVSDAKLVSDYLTKVMGYQEENVVLLTNEKALQSDLTKYFEKWLHNNVEKDGTVFIYYSGHGAPDPKTGGAYLVPYDGDPSFIAETGYSLKRMYDALGKLPAKEIVVALDSCFSGAGGRSVLAKGARPLVMNLQSLAVPAGNMKIIAAASGDQISSTYEEKGHGLFTYFMLKGIKNEDVVKRDGSIAVNNLFSYIKPQVERIARKQYNNEQSPQLIGAKTN